MFHWVFYFTCDRSFIQRGPCIWPSLKPLIAGELMRNALYTGTGRPVSKQLHSSAKRWVITRMTSICLASYSRKILGIALYWPGDVWFVAVQRGDAMLAKC